MQAVKVRRVDLDVEANADCLLSMLALMSLACSSTYDKVYDEMRDAGLTESEAYGFATLYTEQIAQGETEAFGSAYSEQAAQGKGHIHAVSYANALVPSPLDDDTRHSIYNFGSG